MTVQDEIKTEERKVGYLVQAKDTSIAAASKLASVIQLNYQALSSTQANEMASHLIDQLGDKLASGEIIATISPPRGRRKTQITMFTFPEKGHGYQRIPDVLRPPTLRKITHQR